MLRTYLVVTGLGTLLVLAVPSLVTIGFFMLVVPGLILSLMPTAFLYGLVFAVARLVLQFWLAGVPLKLAAGVATLAVMFFIPQTSLGVARLLVASATEPDVFPEQKVALSGDILLFGLIDPHCDGLCAALLKTPGVTSVTVQTSVRGAYTYRLMPLSAPGEAHKAEGFGLSDAEEKYDAADPLRMQRGLEAEWNLMLTSSGRKLVRSKETPPSDFTIHFENGRVAYDPKARAEGPWSMQPDGPFRRGVTVSAANGTVLVRRTEAWADAPAAPFHIAGTGGIENFRFGVGRQRVGASDYRSSEEDTKLLLRHTTIARGVNEGAITANLRAQLERALTDPARPAADPAFALANQWMESFRPRKEPLNEMERQLLLQIIGDPRVTSSDGLWAMVPRIEGDATEFRLAVARRFLAAADKKEARGWLNAFASLPEGAYATLLEEERAILAGPASSLYAYGLVERQGDRGVAAVPDLLRLLRAYSVYDPGKYGFSDLTGATDAVRKAFRRIGPEAAFARSEIEALLKTPGLTYRYETLGKQEWDTLLVVLGRPVETLTKPKDLNGDDARYRERVRERAERPFDPLRE